MKPVKTSFFLFVLTMDLIFHQRLEAQISAEHSVFGNGGAVIENSTYRAIGTFGQPVIGVMMNSTYKHAIGFWYLVKVAEDRFQVTVNLPAGLSIIALPLQPDTPLTASTLAAKLMATLVIKLEAGERFVPFIVANGAGEDFPIEVGKGYIVNLSTAKTIIWEGKPWGEPVPQAPSSSPLNGAWAFVVAGRFEETGQAIPDLHLALVTNLRTGGSVEAPIRRSEKAAFLAVFADLSRRPVVSAGDSLEIQLRDGRGSLVMPPIQRVVDANAIQRAYLIVNIDKRSYLPSQDALLQNYPNPFNPETWMPYQLAADATVVMEIYDAAGALVRRLVLGYQPAGFYMGRGRAAYWDGRDEKGQRLPSGSYFYRLRAGGFSQTRKMILLK